MGIYDRDYYRPQGGFSFRLPQSVVGRLVLLNIAIWLVDSLVFDGQRLATLLGLRPGVVSEPWMWWEFVTYGFVHSVQPGHVLLNMFMLWIFGVEMEALYGPREFLRVYLAMIVVAGVAWTASVWLSGQAANAILMGASGAVTGVTMLFILNNPKRTILFMFVLPIPAWLLGVLLVAYDIFGEVHVGGNVAYVAHLSGAAFALVYFRFGWNLGRTFDFRWLNAWRRPRLRVHNPESSESEGVDEDLSQQVDQILEKIHTQGESSLTRKERRVLEAASRQYQRRRQGGK